MPGLLRIYEYWCMHILFKVVLELFGLQYTLNINRLGLNIQKNK